MFIQEVTTEYLCVSKTVPQARNTAKDKAQSFSSLEVLMEKTEIRQIVTQTRASQVPQWPTTHLPIQEARVRSLGWECLSGAETTPGFLPENSMDRVVLVGYGPWGSQKLRHSCACTQACLHK